MMIKRFYLLIALLLSYNLSAIEVCAYDFESGGIYYDVLSDTDNTVNVTFKTSSYNSYQGQVEIPSRVSYKGSEYKVTEIGKNAFQDCPGLKSVIMPNSVTAIGEKAFYNSGIISVTIGANVTSVGNQAFFKCFQLYKIIMLPNTVPTGLSNAMERLSGRVTYVSNSNFSDYNLGLGITKEYKYLSSLFTVDGVRFLPVSPSDRTCDVIDYDYNKTTSTLTIADKVVNQGIELSVLDIGSYSFYNIEALTEINISNQGVIGDYAFTGCINLQKVNISAHITSIGKGSFQNATKLISITLPPTLNILNDYLFEGCRSLPSIVLPNSITKIGDYCFNDCLALSKIELPSELQTIGRYALAATKISEITIPSKADIIGDGTFNGCSYLSKVAFADGCGTLQLGDNYITYEGLFYDCPLKEVYIGRHLSYNINYRAGYSPFYNKTDLTNVIITNAETDIYNYEFAGCSALKEIVIPSSVLKIGDYSFRDCSSLSKLVFAEGNKLLSLGYNGSNKGLFNDCPLTDLYIGRYLKYNTDSDHGFSPFYRSSTLQKVTISDLPTTVFTNEFYGCTTLTDVKIGDGVTEIGDYAFSGCSSIESFTFGEGMKKIGAEAFSDCTAMTTLVAEAKTPPTCGNQALDDINKWGCKLYIPEEAIDAYKEAPQWKEFFFYEKLYVVDHRLYLVMSDARLSVEFADAPRITFDDGKLVLTSNGGLSQWAFDDFDMWYFGRFYSIESSGINEVEADGQDASIHFDGNTVRISTQRGGAVTLCDIAGHILANAIDSVDIDMTKYPAGVYIVRAGLKSFKFIKK